MADNFYDPSGAKPAEPEKRKPGRPPNATKAAMESAVPIDENLTMEATPIEGETLEEAIARIGALRERNRHEWGERGQKLALPKRAGYHTHWFNDVAGRIDEAKASGWAHRINPRDGKPFHRVVGSGRDGKGLEAYAMDLPLIFWQEEMDARHKVASDKVEGIKKRPAMAQPGQAQASDAGKFYSPNDEKGMDPVHITRG
jgi:hypothetical protein